MATKVKFVSPFGSARYPHLSKPDTVGKYADDKYKTKIALPASSPEAIAFMKKLDEIFASAHPKPNKLCIHRGYTVDEDTDEVIFTFKTTYAPALFDGRNKSLNNKKDPATGKPLIIGGGSRLRVIGVAAEFEKGIALQINQVQVADLQTFGGSAFDEVEGGFSAEDYDDAGAASAFADDSDNDDSNDSTLDI